MTMDVFVTSANRRLCSLRGLARGIEFRTGKSPLVIDVGRPLPRHSSVELARLRMLAETFPIILIENSDFTYLSTAHRMKRRILRS